MPLFSLVGKISLEGAERTREGLAKIKQGADTAAGGLKHLGDVFGFVEERTKALALTVVGAAAAFTPLAMAAGSAFNAFADYDSLTRGLATTTRNAQELLAVQQQIRELAKLPGLGEQEAGSAFLSLRSAGLEANLAFRSITSMGNALASVGKGKAELDGVILALSQIASKGVVSAEEINQIAERVPQIRTLLAQAFGTADTQKIQAMGLTATDAIARIVAEAEKLPRATGGVKNDIENIADAWTRAQRPLGQGLAIAFAAAGPYVEKFIMSIERIGNTVGELIAAVGQSGVLGEVLSSWGVAFDGMDGTITNLLATVMSVAKNLPTFFSDAATYFETRWNQTVQAIQVTGKNLGKYLEDVWAVTTYNMGEYFRSMIDDMKVQVSNLAIGFAKSMSDAYLTLYDNPIAKLMLPGVEQMVDYIKEVRSGLDFAYVPADTPKYKSMPSLPKVGDFPAFGLPDFLNNTLLKDADRFSEMITNGRRGLPAIPDGLAFGGGSASASSGESLFAQWDRKLAEIEKNTGRAANALESRQVFGGGPLAQLGATPAEMSQARLGPDPYTRSVSATMQEAVRRITLQDQMSRTRRAALYGR